MSWNWTGAVVVIWSNGYVSKHSPLALLRQCHLKVAGTCIGFLTAQLLYLWEFSPLFHRSQAKVNDSIYLMNLTEKLKECSSQQFICDDGSCIPMAWVCDGYPDCENFSHALLSLDERNCKYRCRWVHIQRRSLLTDVTPFRCLYGFGISVCRWGRLPSRRKRR